MLKNIIIVTAVLVFSILCYADDRCDEEIFRERLEKIFELKKLKYMDIIKYENEVKDRVNAVLEANKNKILNSMVKKKDILDRIRKLNRHDVDEKQIKEVINRLFDIEKEIIQLNQDQFNQLIKLIKPNDAFLYILLDRRFEHELRDRNRNMDRMRPGHQD